LPKRNPCANKPEEYRKTGANKPNIAAVQYCGGSLYFGVILGALLPSSDNLESKPNADPLPRTNNQGRSVEQSLYNAHEPAQMNLLPYRLPFLSERLLLLSARPKDLLYQQPQEEMANNDRKNESENDAAPVHLSAHGQHYQGVAPGLSSAY
jgi:hypothetical protein